MAKCKHGYEGFCGDCLVASRPVCAHGNLSYCGFCGGPVMEQGQQGRQLGHYNSDVQPAIPNRHVGSEENKLKSEVKRLSNKRNSYDF